MKAPAYNLLRLFTESIERVSDGQGRMWPFRCAVGDRFPDDSDGVLILDPGGHADAGALDPTRLVTAQITVDARSRQGQFHARNLLRACFDTLLSKETGFVLPPPIDPATGAELELADHNGLARLESIRFLRLDGLQLPTELGQDDSGYYRAVLLFALVYQNF